MASYYINEAAFDLPELPFRDETVHILRSSLSEGDLNVLVFRARLAEPKALRDVVASHRDRERRTLAGFAVLAEREIEVAGTIAIEIAFRFRAEGAMIYQKNAHFLLGDVDHLLVAVNAPFEERETCDGTMEHVLSTLQLRTQ